jgi:maltokinase
MARELLAPEGLPPSLVEPIKAYLGRQRWYAGKGAPGELRTVESGLLARLEGSSGRLLWAIVEAAGSQYQLLVAERPSSEGAERVKGHADVFIGDVDGLAYYDATVDGEMALALLAAASGGDERAQRARPLAVEQSNTSIVYDDRLILKVFRRLSPGANPDVEVTSLLAGAGFSHVARPLVRWQRAGLDLAFGQQYLAGGTDGWALALTSLRDFYAATDLGEPHQPALSGGDFAAEATRLGQMTAEMHLAMAKVFATSRPPGRDWKAFVASLSSLVERLGPALGGSAVPLLERLRAVRNPGPAVRVHGDYHLGQVMRTDRGWYVLDFEGEPNRPLEERTRTTSVLKDVAGMLRSLQYASRFALVERGGAVPTGAAPLAQAWEDRNRSAFLHGYHGCKGIEQLLPPAPDDRGAVLMAFELDKALYELAYEEAFRPSWAAIPLAALERLLSVPVGELTYRPVPPPARGEVREAQGEHEGHDADE